MFGSYLVELVVGLCFLFAVLGIVTSAVTEAALSMLKVRSTHLSEWLVQWVGQLEASAAPAAAPGKGPAVAVRGAAAAAAAAGQAAQGTAGTAATAAPLSLQALLAHPLLASQTRGFDQASYLQPAQLATALLQTIAMPFGATCLGQDLKTAEAGLRAHIAGLPSEGLRRAMGALLNNAVGRAVDGTALVARLHVETEAWIDSSMNRVEGWTRRHAKKFSLGAAFVICLAFNVNALEVLRVLSTDPQLRSQLATTAVGYSAQACGVAAAAPAQAASAASAPTQARAASAPGVESNVACLRRSTQDAIGALGPQSRLGIGWDNTPRFMTASGPAVVGEFLGWLIGLAVATFAASLGGDFWFKWIGDIVRLTGYRPATKEEPAPPKPARP